MCRWLAYAGNPIPMSTLLFQPSNSLIRQSLSARRSIVPTNGDGFGLGWYADLPLPGLFRDTMPAWNDANLRSLSEQIRSRLFFAHVRASTGTATTRLNCHPFRHEGWLFMHNGKIGGYQTIRRELEQLIPSAYYNGREGTTDSEVFFLLALANGMATDPVAALGRTVAQVEEVMQANRVVEPMRIAAAASDGRRVVALRYSSDRQSPTLFFASGGEVSVLDGECRFSQGRGSVLVLSEPLDAVPDYWVEVPEAHALVVEEGMVALKPFAPVALV
ncbi:MAG: class II glutamine amidotransferase [Alphaproteobacteria bacterium]|nr:class II glutamine amidotransferase [Alphaproteobacteria bacterium]